MVSVEHPGEEPLQAQAISPVRTGTILTLGGEGGGIKKGREGGEGGGRERRERGGKEKEERGKGEFQFDY